MKKYLSALAATAILLPSLALAAYNDVSLTSSAIISVGGNSITIGASEATLASIVVDSSSFTVTLAPGSSIDMISTDRMKFSTDAAAGTLTAITDSCNSSQSEVRITPVSSTVSVTITPTGTCSTSALVLSGSSSGSGNGPVSVASGSSGGGGGGGGYYNPPAQTTQTAQTTSIESTASTQEQATESSAAISALVTQLRALIAQIKALGGSVSPSLETMLDALPTSAPKAFTRDLEIGMTGDDVHLLQTYLNAHGYIVAESGPGSQGSETNYFGSATRAAVVKLQEAAGITPTAGYFGTRTRAYVEARP
ncbi:peptidoglycan-binding protein [Candidatus Kaiserbacteria bacterium]|nr:peptidoglycan-binding protein [Candidatus Kaiserbacteria bacterium]